VGIATSTDVLNILVIIWYFGIKVTSWYSVVIFVHLHIWGYLFHNLVCLRRFLYHAS
jgi:hypothetical protein